MLLRQLLSFLISFLALQALASSPAVDNNPIRLFSAPDSNKIVQELPGNAVLVPIYRKGLWCEVGDPATGKVGWVNTQQLEKARQDFYRSDIQTVFIHSSQSPQGKPELSVVAYVNGKKVSQEDAKRLYQKIRKQQLWQLKRPRMIFQDLDDEFINDFRFLSRIGPQVFVLPPIESTLPVVEDKGEDNTSSSRTSSKNKKKD